MHSAIHRLQNRSFALLLIRLGVGLVFVYHGYQLVSNMPQTVMYFSQVGISASWAYVAAYAELVGGALVLIGFWTRYAGLVLAVVMLVGIYTVHLKNGFSLQNNGYEYALLLLLASLSLTFTGAGRYSLARYLKHRAVCETCEVGEVVVMQM